jgi:L-lactate dehydrogenase
VSVRLDGEYGLRDACLSLPTAVGGGGVGARVLPDLDDAELTALRRSAEILRSSCAELSYD